MQKVQFCGRIKIEYKYILMSQKKRIRNFLKKVVTHKIVYYGLLIVVFMALLDFFISGYDVIQERYGVNIWVFFYL